MTPSTPPGADRGPAHEEPKGLASRSDDDRSSLHSRSDDDRNSLYSRSDDDRIAEALAEDIGSGDWTTLWTVPDGAVGWAEIRAKAPVVVSGMAMAGRVFTAVDAALRLTHEATDGDRLLPGDRLMRIDGPLRGILTAERTALNFLGRLSGIATTTRRFVEAVAAVPGARARIIDTRKTTPGWRHLEKAAVRHGGGVNHRMGLYDMVLIKENHIAAAGGIEHALRAVRDANVGRLPVEIEVRDLDELHVALDIGVERILLDNMSTDDLRRAVDVSRSAPDGGPELEASGNVTLETVGGVAATGVDLISVGALTHSAPVADLSLRVVAGR